MDHNKGKILRGLALILYLDSGDAVKVWEKIDEYIT